MSKNGSFLRNTDSNKEFCFFQNNSKKIEIDSESIIGTIGYPRYRFPSVQQHFDWIPSNLFSSLRGTRPLSETAFRIDIICKFCSFPRFWESLRANQHVYFRSCVVYYQSLDVSRISFLNKTITC